MANTVNFYHTPFDRQNRPQSVYDYTAYFSQTSGTSVNVNYVVMPNVPFVVPVSAISSADILTYNYIDFLYNGMLVYAFIDKVEYFANENAYYVYHSRDNWAEYLFNYSKYGQIQGLMTRGHTFDITSAGKPTFTDTFSTPEESIITSRVNNDRFIPYKGDSDNQALWLYIYIANPLTVIKYTTLNQGLVVNDNVVTGLGITLCYPIYANKTTVSAHYQVLSSPDGTSGWGSQDLSLMTNENITSMIISPIPPSNNLSTYGGWTYCTDTRSMSWLDTVEGLPQYCNYVPLMELVNFSFSEFVSNTVDTSLDFATYTGIYDILELSALQTTSFTQYLTHIPKLCSSIYNPLYLDNMFIQPDYMPSSTTSTFVSIGLSPDLSQYIYTFTGNTNTKMGRIHYRQTTTTFSPTVLLDYWTRLNASIESMNAQKSKITTVLNAISSTVSSVLNPISSLTGANAANERGNAWGAIGGYANAYSGMATAPINVASTFTSAYYDYQTASANKEIADYQYQTGYTNETGALYLSGIASFTDVPSLNVLYIGVHQEIGMELHRHGYSANVPLYTLFAEKSNNLVIGDTYRRKVFNFVQAESVNILGMNRSMRDDIREMFKYGVTLWSFTTDSSATTIDTDKIANAGDIYQINYGIITGW